MSNYEELIGRADLLAVVPQGVTPILRVGVDAAEVMGIYAEGIVVRFGEGDGWSEAASVSTNDPRENKGYWFFQSFWEPPRRASAGDPGTRGLNFTGLGVGNRNGVRIQLVGCCITALGMVWAWYIKPIIRRRRRERMLGEIAGEEAAR